MAAAVKRPGWKTIVRIVLLVIGAIIAIRIPYTYDDVEIVVFSKVLYLAIAAMGLNLLTGFNGQVSVGHGAFFGVGLFTSAILVHTHGWGFEETLPVSALLTAGIGVLIGVPALRVKGLYLALLTVGLAVLFPSLASRALKAIGNRVGYIKPRRGLSSYFPDMWSDDQYAYFLCLLVLAILMVITYNLTRSRAGRAMIAVRDQEIAASTVGIDVARTKVTTFAISAAFAGLAGSLSLLVGGIADASNPLIYFQLSIELLIIVVIGGAATVTGPLLGAIVIVYLQENTGGSDDVLPKLLGLENPEALAPAMLGIILILLTYVLPDGILGGVRRLTRAIETRIALSKASSGPAGPNDPGGSPNDPTGPGGGSGPKGTDPAATPGTAPPRTIIDLTTPGTATGGTTS